MGYVRSQKKSGIAIFQNSSESKHFLYALSYSDQCKAFWKDVEQESSNLRECSLCVSYVNLKSACVYSHLNKYLYIKIKRKL